MRRTREILVSLEVRYENIGYYYTILDVIEAMVDTTPDIAIESCKSLIEGISKFILRQLDEAYDRKATDKMEFTPLFKKSVSKLSEHCDFVEEDFIRQGCTLIKVLGEVRNNRGDISHGKLAPKEEISSDLFSNLVMQMTDSLVYYILHCFSSVEIEPELSYNQYPDFNDELDADKDLGKVLYSRALFEQDLVTYKEELKNYQDRQNSDDA